MSDDLYSAVAKNKRTELARDVLHELEARTFSASQHVYVGFIAEKGRVSLGFYGIDSEELAAVNGYPCDVCACGSLAVAAVRKGLVTGEAGVSAAVREFFPDEQIALIEAVFMGRGWDPEGMLAPMAKYHIEGHQDVLERWWDRFNLRDPDDDEDGEGTDPSTEELTVTLRAIMLNIIENGGDFKLEDVPR